VASIATHQPQAEPRRSIYYRYRVHAAAPAVAAPDLPVLVVGAGPVGLVTALGLARQGVRCVLLESELQVCEGSRAIVFTRRSMEILQQAGVAAAIVAKGLPWQCGNSFYRGQRVFRMESPWGADDRFAPLTNLQQQYVEQYLVEAVEREPLIDLRWGHKVTRIVRNDDAADPSHGGVALEIATPHGAYEQAARWAVAADGARSALRRLCALELEGAAYEGRFVIADIRVDLPLPTERLAFFDPPWNRGNTVLMHREPEGLWRIDYRLRDDEAAETALAPAVLKERIDAQLAMIGHAGVPWELDWCSVYSARALTLPDYVHGRIAFVGDAAHLLPIFGVRGANTGLQDAQNLAWKLGHVASGRASRALLRSYSHERVAAAREVIGEAGKSTRFMTPPTRGYRLLRDAVLSLSLKHAFVRPLYHWRTSRAHDYLDSPLNTPDDGVPDDKAPRPGAPLPNLKVGADDFLLDRLCGPAAGRFALIVREDFAGSVAQGFEVVRLPPTAAARLGLASATAALLVRPDQHVAARLSNATPERLRRALARALGHAETEAPPC
jgi:3-(3-hydroxy-phenyl)propionate hydroxylase